MCHRLKLKLFGLMSKEEDVNTNNEPWQGFYYDYRTLNKKLESSGLIQILADFFIYAGDVCSILYTNSLAAHSGPMREHSLTTTGAPSNAYIVKNNIYNKYIQTHTSIYIIFF